ncbi:hypothetical protein [Modestobacter sp. I12A-02662]|uniref:hypothetical protein n=1 Tax=Modestobacter sp. I12A-02662 TaxID=1730496 RepID=UPI0034DE4AF6
MCEQPGQATAAPSATDGGAAATCAARPEADVRSAEGWLGWLAWAATTTAGTAADLAALHASLSAGDPPAARQHLEWQPPPAGYAGLGFKGGALPGVRTEAITVRRDDGTTGVGVLLVESLDVEEWTQTLTAALPHSSCSSGR